MQNNNNTPDELTSYINLAKIVYVLQLSALLLGGIPFFIGAFINYTNKDKVAGSWLESHYRWQLNSFIVVIIAAAVTAITWPFGIGLFILLIVVIWVIHRVIYGWIALRALHPVVFMKKKS